jgi:hypothetical protein
MPIPNATPHWGRASLLAAVLASVGGLAFTGHIQCVLARVAHVPCPGCGTTRTAVSLAHGDVGRALALNPWGLVVAVCVLLLALDAVRVTWRDGSPTRSGTGPFGRWVTRALLVALAVDILVWAVRWVGWFGGPVLV